MLSAVLTWAPRVLMSTWVAFFLFLHFLAASIPSISSADFNREAVELERTTTWRYGYVFQYHGALLVKTAAASDAPALAAPRADDDIAAALSPEIHRRHLKGWAELGLYLLLFGYTRLVRMYRNGRWPEPSVMRVVSGSVAVFGFVTLALGPYLVMGYGEPLFSTYGGPGAITSAGLVPTTSVIEPAVSYTAVVQQVVAVAVFGSPPFATTLERWIGLRATLWLWPAAFWALVALVVPALAEVVIRLSLWVWPKK